MIGQRGTVGFPELILGALLTLAAVAIGMILSAEVNEPVKVAGELLTGVATVALAIVTFLLVKATKLLATTAEEDGHNRKVQATVDAWMKVREELDFSDLTKEKPDKIQEAGDEARPQLRKLEAFSQVVNSGVFDLETFSKISGNWFVQQVRWMNPYISQAQKQNEDAYKEIIQLEKTIQGMKSSPQDMTNAPKDMKSAAAKP